MDSVISTRILNRRKKDPNEFIFTGEKQTGELDIQLFRYSREKIEEATGLKPQQVQIPANDNFKYWLNVYGIHDTSSIALICKNLGVDSLTIQDILDVNQRPKFQEFDNYNFFTIRVDTPLKQ
ncbi:MAG: hypothetical protein U5L72_01710 [Bacteroidales bacterium]|nr:hypothetical protein [Bacteroidales bacterium]